MLHFSQARKTLPAEVIHSIDTFSIINIIPLKICLRLVSSAHVSFKATFPAAQNFAEAEENGRK